MSELGGGWRIGHAQPGGDLKGPSGLLLRLSGIDPAVDRGQDELSGFIRLQDTEVGDDGRRATAAQTGRLALRTAAKETGRSAEVDLNGEATALVRGDQVGPIGPGGDLHTPARTRQAYLRLGRPTPTNTTSARGSNRAAWTVMSSDGVQSLSVKSSLDPVSRAGPDAGLTCPWSRPAGLQGSSQASGRNRSGVPDCSCVLPSRPTCLDPARPPAPAQP